MFKQRLSVVGYLILIFNIYSAGQASVGIGLISISFNDKAVINFYTSPESLKPAHIIVFFNDKSINSWNIKNLETHKKWLLPELLNLDYSGCIFRCNRQKENWYEVIVNNDTGKKYWIKKNEITRFLNWESYLKSMFGVERHPLHKQSIYQQPTTDSKLVYYQGNDCFQIKSMKGDWIEIFTPDICDDYTNTNIKSGWIKWKDGNTILIEYYITS